ncbi:MAG: glycosyltransferase family 39 protein, partial [candidate division Zixibacteria bacterium]|nr:glycosyltransferase family 39 protein [candidate division Zixibacteria bacterium]
MTPARFWSDEPAYVWQQAGPIRARGFILAIILSAVLDLGAFLAAQFAGFTVVGAHLISFACAAVLALLLPPKSSATEESGRVSSLGLSLIVALLVLFLRGSVLALLLQKAGFSPLVAMVPVALCSALLLHSGKVLQLTGIGARSHRQQRWHTLAISLVLYSIVLRLVYIGVPNLIPEEAYYWNYAQHLDWGYLDHPPMVAWIIKLGTLSFGNSEFGVRIGALVCWLVAAGFAYALARELLGRRSAVGVMLLVSTLPFYFGAGCLMTPDAPLTACWSGALYFLHRAILRERPGAWIGAGVCIGLGMLSKYTIGLLVLATFLCLLIDSQSRRWLARPQPYLAGLIAAALFLPVIYWNATHNWASFVFQTARRINEPSVFSLHTLLGECMVLLTPTVFAGALVILASRRGLAQRLSGMMDAGRRRLLLLSFTLIPLAVVTVFSLTHEPKLNWTGPAWLATLPYAAWVMMPSQKSGGGFTAILRWLWRPTFVGMLLLFGAVFHYLA